MKTLPKIIKGDIPLTVNFALEHAGLIITPIEAEKFNKMLISVFNAGKGGVVSDDIIADFAEFYKLYPRRKAKKKALSAYVKALKEVTHDEIMEGLRAQLPEIMVVYNTDKSKVLHPASWLNNGSWDDEVEGKPAVNSDIMTDADIFSNENGQCALEEGLGFPLRMFCIKKQRMPTKEEYKELQGKTHSGFINSESKKLANQYLKG